MAWLSRNKRPSSVDPQPVADAASASGGATAGNATDTDATDATDTASGPEMGRFGPKVALTRFDVAPPELDWQLPVNGELYRLMPGPDRPDYSVMVLERPLHFYPADTFDLSRLEPDQRTEDRRGRTMVRVHALLLCARFVGQQLRPGMSDLAVNLAYVIDNSLARDEVVDFAKIEYAAVGLVSEGHRGAAVAATATATDTGTTLGSEGAPGASEPSEVSEATTVADPDPDVAPVEPAAAPVEPAAVPVPGPDAVPVPGPDAVPVPGPDAVPVEPGDLAEDAPPPMIVVGEVFPEVARTLRDGIAQQRGTAVEAFTVTLTLDEQHRVVGLAGNADGAPPVPTPETFALLNDALARLNTLPANHAIKGLTLRVDGNDFSSDVDYRN